MNAFVFTLGSKVERVDPNALGGIAADRPRASKSTRSISIPFAP